MIYLGGVFSGILSRAVHSEVPPVEVSSGVPPGAGISGIYPGAGILRGRVLLLIPPGYVP